MADHHLLSFLNAHSFLQKEDVLAVAVSGGPDSMALLHMLMVWARENNKKLHILTVDHGLRAESKDEARDVALWAATQKIDGVDHYILTWEGAHPEAGIMEAARKERYRLMAEHCSAHQIKYLLVAHHQGDQAETFLIRLAKGSGLDGLAAMNAFRPCGDDVTLVRPLLGSAKEDLIGYCILHDIPFVKDASNENEDYMRPRLRASMDVLAGEGLTEKRLAVTAKRISRARQALEAISDKVFDQALREKTTEQYVFDFVTLKNQPAEIALRVIRKALEDLRPTADYQVRMEKLEELFESLWYAPTEFKPRTLGGCIFALKDKNKSLWVRKEEG